MVLNLVVAQSTKEKREKSGGDNELHEHAVCLKVYHGPQVMTRMRSLF